MAEIQDSHPSFPRRWVVMGVSGSGKTEIGRRLATRLGVQHVEGDEEHSEVSIRKMAAGIPLDDEDRRGWLLRLQVRIRDAARHGRGMVLSCSALKRRYRDLLRQGDPDLVFVHLQGDGMLIASRMRARSGHFMPVRLLDSQFADLEPLQADERGVGLDVEATPDELVSQAIAYFDPSRAEEGR